MALGSTPARIAPVPPRVFVGEEELARPLVETVAELLARRRVPAGPSLLLVTGAAGSGKTSAACHLAAVFADEARLSLQDDATIEELTRWRSAASPDALLVATTREPTRIADATHCRLATWDDDDCLAWLACHDRVRAADAYARWRATELPHDLRDRPALCAKLLAALLAREDLPDAFSAIDAAVAAEGDGEALERLRHAAVLAVSGALSPDRRPPKLEQGWLASGTVRSRLAAQFLLDALELRHAFDPRLVRISSSMLVAATHLVLGDPERSRRLLALADGIDAPRIAWWLSILCAALDTFRPPLRVLHDPVGTFAPKLDARGLVFSGSLRHIVLESARLTDAEFRDVDATGIDLSGADAERLRADRAILRGADLRAAKLVLASLCGADLRAAKLQTAVLRGADLREADLRGASFQSNDLRFVRADRAVLRGLDLRSVLLDGAILDGADLRAARLSQKRFDGLSAVGADFSDADLSASVCRAAKLRGARLCGARLAELDAEGADLRDADLSRASFHLGSTRGGLVGSELASEGTRTGFYTDEALDDSFAAPELVRKANLCDVDLRGAKLEGTDFYLVDVRGARLDPAQVEWLRRCKAIFERPRRT